MKILVADDSLVSRHLLQKTLSNWGYDVVLAGDGLQAWDILQREDAPHLAILDWMMPGLSGPQVCRNVRGRAREPYTYLLLLTSKSLKEDLIEGMESGADDYVVKPFDHNELNVRLRAGKRVMELQWELMAAREALREQATTDALTKLWNRTAILDHLDAELARAERELRPIGLILLDLDHFKNINDTFGHYTGDLALQEASLRMRRCVRAYDAVGRYGGEEFLILVPGCDEKSTFAQAERLRSFLADAKVEVPGGQVTLTASFGCTSALPGRNQSGDMLIRRADEALYVAKRMGRNRVEFLAASDGVHLEQLVVPIATTT